MTIEEIKTSVEKSRKAREKLARKLALEEARKNLEQYYACSISGSVLSDIRNGNVKIIHC